MIKPLHKRNPCLLLSYSKYKRGNNICIRKVRFAYFVFAFTLLIKCFVRILSRSIIVEKSMFERYDFIRYDCDIQEYIVLNKRRIYFLLTHGLYFAIFSILHVITMTGREYSLATSLTVSFLLQVSLRNILNGTTYKPPNWFPINFDLVLEDQYDYGIWSDRNAKVYVLYKLKF